MMFIAWCLLSKLCSIEGGGQFCQSISAAQGVRKWDGSGTKGKGQTFFSNRSHAGG